MVAPSVDPDPKSTFVRHARRSQLVEAAIAVIAELGVERASTVAVAKRAGVSRGVLTHHFSGRDDLLEAVVAEVYAVARRALGPSVARATDPREALLTFVSGSVDFYAAHPDHMQALREIFSLERRPDAPGRREAADHVREEDAVAAILRDGVAAGCFRALNVITTYHAIRAVLDSALARIRACDDVEDLRAELVAFVDAATRANA